jgi:hypothetical protein
MSSTTQQIKNAAIAKAKSAANSVSATVNGTSNTNGNGNGNGNTSNGSASKKRRGNNQLKPIITTENQQDAESANIMAPTNLNLAGYVLSS